MGQTAITNALIFDGQSLHTGLTVIIEDGLINSIGSSLDISNADKILDCQGSTLLPGFIDAHIHLAAGPEKCHKLLLKLAKAGVTTALEMGFLPGSLRDGLRSPGVTDIRFAGTFATSTGSTHSRFPGCPKSSIVDNEETAVQFVKDRVAEGADYIKIVADIPGPSQDIVDTLVSEARKHGKLTVAHASRKGSFAMAQEGKVDIITHAPLDKSLDGAAAGLMADEGRACVPTLVMMKALGSITSVGLFMGLRYAKAKESVKLLHEAGVPILAGTDSNSNLVIGVEHGKSMHQEFKLLAEAGLSNEDVLRAATSLPAKWFRMEDRGVIAAGKRADLVLVHGNPVENIAFTCNVQRVWIAGKEVGLKG